MFVCMCLLYLFALCCTDFFVCTHVCMYLYLFACVFTSDIHEYNASFINSSINIIVNHMYGLHLNFKSCSGSDHVFIPFIPITLNISLDIDC